MKIFLTVLAALWFVLMTCIGNYGAFQRIRQNPNLNIVVQPWTLLVDLIATAYLIARLFGA